MPGPIRPAPSKPAPGEPPSSISEALADVAAGAPESALVDEKRAFSQGAPRPPEPPPLLTAEKTPLPGTSKPAPNPTLDEIDKRFETIISEPPGPGQELTPEELREAQRLFLEISVNYLRPLRDLIVEIDLGEPTREWLSVCRPAVASLRRAAMDMALEDLGADLGGLLTVIEQGERGIGSTLDARTREALKAAWGKLAVTLPQAFSVEQTRTRREPLIVFSLLQQVPDVRKVTLDRIVAAGLTTLEQLYKAKPGDIADAAGIPKELAERIVARFQRYRRELGTAPPSPSRQREKAQLDALAKKLEDQNNAFDASSRHWSHAEEKRRLRQERAATLLEIRLLLARLGEVELIDELEPLPFQKKAETLRRYLSAQNE
ncbi:MAG TPA: helix-hairpin-helix domain-containing protein [Polyangiaceae bacterium]|nr:helix-hairpin-helix domain-containing protein [Polyangiaceae bacterium]